MKLCLILSPTSLSHTVVNFLIQRKLHSAKFQHDSKVLFSTQRRLGGRQSWTRKHPPAVEFYAYSLHVSVTGDFGWTEREKPGGATAGPDSKM